MKINNCKKNKSWKKNYCSYKMKTNKMMMIINNQKKNWRTKLLTNSKT